VDANKQTLAYVYGHADPRDAQIANAQYASLQLGLSILARCYMKYLLTLLIVLLIPTAALAKGECRQDRKKFCAGMVKKELWDCLSKHQAELASPCKMKIEARAKAKKERSAQVTAPSAAPGANYSSPSTDTQPQPTYPAGEPK